MVTMIDWRLSQAQRDVVAKRAELEALDAYVARLGVLLAEAEAFDGEYRDRLRAIGNRVFEIGPRVSVSAMAATRFSTPEDLAETARLEDERATLERDVARAKEARTTLGANGLAAASFCSLDPIAVGERRRRVIGARDATAAEVAQLERQLSAGELCQVGVEAPDSTAHREQVERLRQRIGIEG